jgi:hypothetical protein
VQSRILTSYPPPPPFRRSHLPSSTNRPRSPPPPLSQPQPLLVRHWPHASAKSSLDLA